MCSLLPEGKLSAMDYLRWLSVEMSGLPNMFVGVNENFISAMVEGTLMMVFKPHLQRAGSIFCPLITMCEGMHERCQKSGGTLLATITCWLLFALSTTRYLFACNLCYFNLVIVTLLLPF
jgi:hypothetical protein